MNIQIPREYQPSYPHDALKWFTTGLNNKRSIFHNNINTNFFGFKNV